jgi:hypothetical protein
MARFFAPFKMAARCAQATNGSFSGTTNWTGLTTSGLRDPAVVKETGKEPF